MGDRLPTRATVLTVIGVVVALAIGGVAALLIASDDDPADDATATVSQRDSSQPDTTERTSTDRATTEPSDDEGAAGSGQGGGATTEEGSEAEANAGTTRFPVERTQDPDRTGRRFSDPPRHRFTGNGNALIGTVDVRATAVVRWNASGRIEIRFGSEAFAIEAPSKSGQVVVPPYKLERVRVIARRPWTITVTPQG
jgi:hypothetical protein